MDWGVSGDMEDDHHAGPLSGTPMYMSPEQAQQMPQDARSDLYSVGALFYELLCLQQPMPHNDNPLALVAMVPTYEPPDVDKVHHPDQGYAPSEYKLFVKRAMEKAPADRFSSAAEMLYELDAIQTGVFCSVCPRTFIKSRLFRFMRWLDINPFRNVPIVLGVTVTVGIGLLGLGLCLGLALG